MRLIVLLSLPLLCGCYTTQTTSTWGRSTYGWLGSTVRVDVSNGAGSGVVIKAGDQPIVMTAAHVLDGDDGSGPYVHVFTYNADGSASRVIMLASIIVTDATADLALLRLPAGPAGMVAVSFADTSPELLEPVWASTCLGGLGPTATYGHVTTVGTTFGGVPSFVVSTSLGPGSSGGGVYVQRNGRMVLAGIARAVISPGGQPVFDIGYATDIGYIKDWLKTHGTK